MFDILKQNKKHVEGVIVGSLLSFVLFSGGKPFSVAYYKALETQLDVKLPTYNMAELMDIISVEEEYTKKSQSILNSKLVVDSISKFEDLLTAEGIPYISVPAVDESKVILRVEREADIKKLNKLISDIDTENGLRIYVKYLNNNESIIELTYEGDKEI